MRWPSGQCSLIAAAYKSPSKLHITSNFHGSLRFSSLAFCGTSRIPSGPFNQGKLTSGAFESGLKNALRNDYVVHKRNSSHGVAVAPDCAADTTATSRLLTVEPTDPLVYFHGRWDDDYGSWWGGTGFKIYAHNLSRLLLKLGPNTTPDAAVGISINYGAVMNIPVSEGINNIPLLGNFGDRTLVRINVQGWRYNRMNLQGILLNAHARLLPYQSQRLAFQFIGDSLTSGVNLAHGINGSYGFLVGEEFKAEHNIQSQPGICLTNQECWGNSQGMTYQYFKTEDCGYQYSPEHPFLTDWDFKKDQTPTHVFINIGANDHSYNIPGDSFVETYLTFIARLRELYPDQPFFVIGPWGWPMSHRTVLQYYEGRFEEIVNKRKFLGDNNIYLIDTQGWIKWHDVFHDDHHPSDSGHKKIAGRLSAWLQKWGLRPDSEWANPL